MGRLPLAAPSAKEVPTAGWTQHPLASNPPSLPVSALQVAGPEPVSQTLQGLSYLPFWSHFPQPLLLHFIQKLLEGPLPTITANVSCCFLCWVYSTWKVTST